MQAERSDLTLAQRAIVMQVLREDHPERWSRAELESATAGDEPWTTSDALASLEAEGVVIVEGDQVWASRCARRLDSLGLVSV